MASQKKSATASTERPPAEQVARDLYKQQFGTTKPDAQLPSAELERVDPQEVPVTPPVAGDEPPKED